MPQKKLLFLTLNTFSSTGGIEKVCRIAGKAFHQIANENGYEFAMYSMYDHQKHVIEKYVPRSVFEAFCGNRIRFVKEAIKAGRKSETVVLSHVNLLLVGYLIKLASPKTKVLLIAHGIEVWHSFPRWKVSMLRKLDLVLPVSEFTRQKMLSLYGLDHKKLEVVNNCLDPFLTRKLDSTKQAALRAEYGLSKDDKILFTLTRLKSTEQYKGYDRVILALPEILKRFPAVKYLIAGKYDETEKERLDQIIKSLQLEEKVIFTGYADDKEIEKLFTLADLYIMPSSGEGFGIVFIEAMFYGKTVIAGNVDGSVDALDKGKLGLLVDPYNKEEIVAAVAKVLVSEEAYIPKLPEVELKFSFVTYRNNLLKVIKLKRQKPIEELASI